MPAWLTEFAPALFALLKKAASSLGFATGFVLGRRDQSGKQSVQDMEVAAKARRARSNVKHTSDSVRDDPNNRDDD